MCIVDAMRIQQVVSVGETNVYSEDRVISVDRTYWSHMFWHLSSLSNNIHPRRYYYTPLEQQIYLFRANNHNKVPDTKNTEEGSARRNITRKHDHDPNK